jgi:uncharacterized membrane protein YfcA
MLEYIITFFALFALDIVYTYYLRCVQENKAIGASSWSVACYILGSIAVINYTTNHWLLIPAMAGAFAGTWVGMKIKLRSLNEDSRR